MKKKGLCATCVNLATCIFIKEPPVWQCEEFSQGNSVPARLGQAEVRRVIREQITENE